MDEFVKEVDPVILALAGILIPLVLAVINSVAWTAQLKALVAALVTLGLGAGMGYVMGMRDGPALVTSAVGVYAWSQIVYGGALRPLGVTTAIEGKVLPRG